MGCERPRIASLLPRGVFRRTRVPWLWKCCLLNFKYKRPLAISASVKWLFHLSFSVHCGTCGSSSPVMSSTSSRIRSVPFSNKVIVRRDAVHLQHAPLARLTDPVCKPQQLKSPSCLAVILFTNCSAYDKSIYSLDNLLVSCGCSCVNVRETYREVLYVDTGVGTDAGTGLLNKCLAMITLKPFCGETHRRSLFWQAPSRMLRPLLDRPCLVSCH